MVALSSRFALLAALSSIAALTTAPVYTEAAAIQPQYRDALDYPIVARHSSHPNAKADVRHGHRGSSKSEMKVAAKDASTNKTADKQRHPKPVVPLPARLAQKNSHKGSSSTAESSASEESHREATGSKHAKSAVCCTYRNWPMTLSNERTAICVEYRRPYPAYAAALAWCSWDNGSGCTPRCFYTSLRR